MARQPLSALNQQHWILRLSRPRSASARRYSHTRQCLALLLFCTSSLAYSSCENTAGRLESSEGTVSVEHNGSWQTLAVGACIPIDSRIQVSDGRAVFRLSNETLLRASGSTLLRIAQPQEKNWIKLFDGLLHIITRTPHAFDVETEYVNAGVKGTEFIIASSHSQQRADIVMFEGEVLASNTLGQQNVASGKGIVAQAGQAPTVLTVPALRNAVQWDLYYPPVSRSNSARFAALQDPLSRGNATAALKLLDAIPAAQRDADYHAQLGAVNLSRGEPELARIALNHAIAEQPEHAQALALQVIVLLASGNTKDASALLESAQTHTKNNSSLQIARSYLEQARFDLVAAQASAQQAANTDSANPWVFARLAELALINGDTQLANKATDTALRLQPNFSRALAIKGFIQLQQLRLDEAESTFKLAVAQNPSEPLPHLGLGLIDIRHNRVADGREQLAMAVALDPGQSLLRSYLGKAYQEEGRERLAADQFQLAKSFDSADPTPWFYSALQAQAQNRPFDALDDLNRSIELNDNRAVYRSRLQLDADEAARTASQSEIYRKLGFDELAQRSAARAVSTAPNEYGGHRQLAEAYADDPQYDTARASEVLQAQLLQPLSATPLQPILGETNLLAIEGAGPSALGYREYNAMFVREKPWLSVSALGGGNSTSADEVTLSGVEGRIAYALNQYHYETIGRRDNGDARYDIVTAYAKVQATENLSVLLSASRREEDRGNIEETLLTESVISFLNEERTVDSTLLGGLLALSPSINVLTAVSYQEEQLRQITGFSYFGSPLNSIIDRNPRTINAELQGQFSNSWGHLIAGVDWSESAATIMLRSETSDPFLQPLLGSPEVSNETDHYFSGYGYWSFTPIDSLDLIAGVSFAELSADAFTRPISGWYPKLAAVYRLNTDVELRAGYFQSLKRPSALEQTLEPTQLGGFNQLNDETDGIESSQYSGGIDIYAGRGHQFGAEASLHKSKIPFAQQSIFSADADTTQAQVYWSWATKPWSISVKYQYEKSEFNNTNDTASDIPSPLKSYRIPARIQWQSEKGWALSATTTYVHQNADFYPNGVAAGATSEKDQFSLLDVAATYQFWSQHAELAVRVNNALNESFRYQSTNMADPTPRLPAYMPERVVLLGFKVAY